MPRTTCAHNAPGQVIRADHPTPCRKCGALIQASPRATSLNGNVPIPSEGAINAAYPGDGNATSQANAFGR